MDIYEALYTTRAMRRVKPDPIPLAVQRKILDAAIRAPSGGNTQMWRFLLVDDAAQKARLGPIYRACLSQLWETIYKPRADAAAQAPDAPESREFVKMQRSASWLADHFESYPLFLFAFSQFDTTGSSIFPAVWSAMLAARAEGIGSALTSVMMFRMARGARSAGRAEGSGLELQRLRELRRADREVGRGPAHARARGELPQPLGQPGRLRDPGAALAAKR